VLVSDALRRRGSRPARLEPETVEKLNALLPAGWGGGNPVNVFADASAERYGEALAILLEDPGTDAVLVVNTPTALGDPVAIARAVAGQSRREKPVFAVWLRVRPESSCASQAS
jgi:acetyltransferase